MPPFVLVTTLPSPSVIISSQVNTSTRVVLPEKPVSVTFHDGVEVFPPLDRRVSRGDFRTARVLGLCCVTFIWVWWKDVEVKPAAFLAVFKEEISGTSGLFLLYAVAQRLFKVRKRAIKKVQPSTYGSRLLGSPAPLRPCSWP